jgi:hypothetical protein
VAGQTAEGDVASGAHGGWGVTQDRKRIQHLLALTEPVEQEITYARQGRPDTFHLLPKQPAMGGHNATCVPPRRGRPAGAPDGNVSVTNTTRRLECVAWAEIE